MAKTTVVFQGKTYTFRQPVTLETDTKVIMETATAARELYAAACDEVYRRLIPTEVN